MGFRSFHSCGAGYGKKNRKQKARSTIYTKLDPDPRKHFPIPIPAAELGRKQGEEGRQKHHLYTKLDLRILAKSHS